MVYETYVKFDNSTPAGPQHFLNRKVKNVGEEKSYGLKNLERKLLYSKQFVDGGQRTSSLFTKGIIHAETYKHECLKNEFCLFFSIAQVQR